MHVLWRGLVTGLVLGAVLAAAGGERAWAQVCGDATGDGTVTDTDGVQVLRAAALLSSTCTSGVCDVNGDGSINDTDGVLTLRLAALLPVETACSVATEVEAASADVVPFFAVLLPQAPGIAAGSAGIETTVEDCPAGGTRTKRDLGTQLQVQFDLCRINDPILGSYEFDGNVALNLALPQFFIRVDILDLTTSRLVQFEGPIDPSFGANDTVVFNGGPVVISTPQGDFDMTFDNFVVDQDGRPIGGAASVTDTDDNFDLAMIAMSVNGDSTADLVASFDDGSTENFLLNLITGDLVPVG
jgi:hypothetical protein